MSTLEDILDQLYFSATDEQDKGDKFEPLMLQFFKTDLQWSERFADVWLWMDWPHRPLAKAVSTATTALMAPFSPTGIRCRLGELRWRSGVRAVWDTLFVTAVHAQ